jgi:hypothetical protein
MFLTTQSCDQYESPDPRDFVNDSLETKQLYVNLYDQKSDQGQFWFPTQSAATNYWVMIGANSNNNNFDDNSLRNHLLGESIVGLMALAVNEGRSNTMVWTDVNNSSYLDIIASSGMTHNGNQTTWELIGQVDEIREQINGYVLCKVRNEESISAAAIASHVYRSIIVDEFYQDSVIALGYEMTYDARDKTTADAWNEFKDQCNNNALVLMPTQTGNLKSFAIANRLMMVNYNKKMGTSNNGTNAALFNTILDWLEPLSPVLGWEQGLGEDAFVEPISRSGNVMVPSDWMWNVPAMSADYAGKQSGLATVSNPHYYDYDSESHFVSFLMSDGDNVQWMMNNFLNNTYFLSTANNETQMSFGVPLANLSMMAPQQMRKIFDNQGLSNTVVEFGGGGYYYPDNFAENKNREELLGQLAVKLAHHMRQHRTKVLGLIAKDVTSEEAKQAYQAYISANDQLEGIVVFQYHPYAGGDGEVMWFTNAEGYDIPVITARYAIWNHGNNNLPNQGTPTYISQKINELAASSQQTFSMVAVHAWSRFSDIGDSDDPLAENLGGSSSGVLPVSWTVRKLDPQVKVVNLQELIWQLRMKEKPEQTNEFLSKYY